MISTKACKKSIIYEKNQGIPILNNLSPTSKESFSNNYSLKQNFFDPSKSSPPNEFMNKLKMRMNVYSDN